MGSMAGGLSLGTLWINIAADVDAAVKSLQDFGRTVGEEIDAQKAKWDGLKDVGQGLTTVGAGLTAALTLPLVGVGAAALKASEGLNTAKIGFTTMLGSAEAADKMLKEIQQFAATTPFEFPDLVQAAQKMKALGFESSQIIPTLRTVGDTAAAMGKGKDAVDSITLALGQMQAKGKVSAEEMNQLAERGIPAWKILADSIGVSIPEAMKLAEKGAIQASQAVPALLDGMNTQFAGSMDKMSQTLTGQWSNFKDQVTLALIPIGQALVPALQGLLPILTAVLTKVGEAATWFTNLPQPIQTVALAFGAVAAAIGPLLVVAGTMISAFATVAPVLAAMGAALAGVTAATLAVPLAIAAVTAALVALGVWIYSNWDAIVAVLTVAWDGVKEAWAAVWGVIGGALTAVWNGYMALWHLIWDPIIAAALAVWNAVAPYFTAVWNGIASFLGGVWDGIKATATAVWGAITGAIDGFLKFAAKIPGVNKLFDLDDAWKSAKKLGEETKTAGEAAKAATPQIKTVAAAVAAQGAAAASAHPKITKHKDETVKLATATHDFVAPGKSFSETIDYMHKKTVPATTALYNFGVEAEKSRQKTIDMKMPTVDLGDYMKATFTPAGKDAAAALKDIGDQSELAKPDVVLLQEALANLGLDGAQKMADLSAAAAASYKTIVASDLATQFQKDSALIKLLEAEQAAMKANGIAIPADHQKMLDDLKAKTENTSTGLPATTGKFAEFGTQVSTIITNFAQDISKSLWDGNTSFGEKGKALLSSLGQAVTSSFIEPATAAISSFISGAIKNLLGGDGLGGVFDSIKNIGSSFSGIFSGGKTPGVPSVPGTSAPGGAGGIGGAGSALGSITGIVGAVGSIGTLISSIVFGIQQEKDMDTLADHTLRTFNELANLRIDEWVRWGDFLLIKDDLIRPLNNISDLSNLFVLKFDDIITRLNWIADQSAYTSQALDAILASADVRGEREDSMLARMLATVERIAVSGERALTMNLYGTDPSLVGGRVAQQLRLQGGFA